MATYTHEDLTGNVQYRVIEFDGAVPVKDIDNWDTEGVGSFSEYEYDYDTKEEALDHVRRINAEGDRIVEDVENNGLESGAVDMDDEGRAVFYISYVFDAIEVIEECFDKRNFVGDKFNIKKGRGGHVFKSMNFKNCTFFGGPLEFHGCKFYRCKFKSVRNKILLNQSTLEYCDFRESDNMELTVKHSELRVCKFSEVQKLRGSFRNLSYTSGLTVEQTDPNGDRRRDPSLYFQLTIEEKASVKERLRREEEEARRVAIQDVTKRVSKAKSDKELEALAQEVGSLQAQPQYVREHKKALEEIQAEIEKKYSVVGKGIRYLKRLFSRGKRASQIRVAGQMNRELQREIKALKRDLNK